MNTQETTKRRGRPAGVTNKAATMRVPLSELITMFAPTALIPVKRSFAMEILGLEEDDEPEGEEAGSKKKEPVEEPLSFTRRQPNPDREDFEDD